jgi:hypothetical protein
MEHLTDAPVANILILAALFSLQSGFLAALAASLEAFSATSRQERIRGCWQEPSAYC